MFHLSPLRNKMLWRKGQNNPSDHMPPLQSKAGLNKTLICDIIFIQQKLEGSLHCCRSKSLPEYSMVLLGYSVQRRGKFKAVCLMLFPQILTINFTLELAATFFAGWSSISWGTVTVKEIPTTNTLAMDATGGHPTALTHLIRKDTARSAVQRLCRML